MTPQERQLVDELFDRLRSLEGQARDPAAEQAIAEGLQQAPNAVYALVQTVLVQDEALKRANARIQELETVAGAETPRDTSFLGSMRSAVLGREPRGSVPSVGSSEHGRAVWGDRYAGGPAGGDQPMGAPPMPPRSAQPEGAGYAGQAGPGYPAQAGPGGSFLGTAAASAAGVIGGALLLNSIRSMFGGAQAHAGAFDPGLSGSPRTPWSGGDAAGSGLARDAGLDDIGRSRNADYGERSERSGLFGGNDDTADASLDDPDSGDYDDDSDVAGDFDDGDFGGDDIDTA